MAKSQAPSWEDIVNVKPTEEEENWDREDSQSTVAHQFEDVVIEEVIESVTEEELEPPVTGELLTQLGGSCQKHCGPKGYAKPCRGGTIVNEWLFKHLPPHVELLRRDT